MGKFQIFSLLQPLGCSYLTVYSFFLSQLIELEHYDNRSRPSEDKKKAIAEKSGYICFPNLVDKLWLLALLRLYVDHQGVGRA